MRQTFPGMVFFFGLALLTGAETIRLSPSDDWFGTLSGEGLNPGDEVVLARGVYSDRRLFEMKHVGTGEKPIVIRGEGIRGTVFKRPDARQNSINLVGARHLVLKNIEITGGAAGIRIRKSAHRMAGFITLEGLHIHHIGGVAVTANNPGNQYEGLVFRRNHIHHTGGHAEGFYLGCNNDKNGKTPGYVFNSIVENNYIHDLKGPGVSQGDGIEIKDGSYGNIIRDNVIHDTNYPGIIVYGADGKESNLIERNVIWNSGDHGIQAAADAVIRNNIILHSAGDGIHSRQHQSAASENLDIRHNTVVSKRRALRIVSQRPDTLTIGNNVFHGAAEFPSRGGKAGGNIVKKPTSSLAIDGLFPKSADPEVGAGEAAYSVDVDFNGSKRTGKSVDAGAYRFDARGNPGWKVAKTFKAMR